MKINTDAAITATLVCDYIPVISTLAAIIELIAKISLEKRQKPQGTDNHYYEHIKNKEIWTLLVLMIPVIGNLVIALYDGGTMLLTDELEPHVFINGRASIKDNKVFVLNAVKTDPNLLQHVSKRMRGDKDVIRASVNAFIRAKSEIAGSKMGPCNNPFSLASEELRTDREFILEMIKKDFSAYLYGLLPGENQWVSSYYEDFEFTQAVEEKIKDTRIGINELIKTRNSIRNNDREKKYKESSDQLTEETLEGVHIQRKWVADRLT